MTSIGYGGIRQGGDVSEKEAAYIQQIARVRSCGIGLLHTASWHWFSDNLRSRTALRAAIWFNYLNRGISFDGQGIWCKRGRRTGRSRRHWVIKLEEDDVSSCQYSGDAA